MNIGQVIRTIALLAALGSLFPTFAPAQEQPPLPAIGAEIHNLLVKELTTRWYPQSLDHKRGGFHQTFARDWSPVPDSNVFLVYQSRLVWTAAAFAEYSPQHREEFLRYARHGIDFLDRVMRDQQHGGFHWILDPSGQVSETLGTEKHLYGTSFVIYAASTMHRVSGDERALKVAQDAFHWLDQHGHDAEHGGYFEAYQRDGTPILHWNPEKAINERTDRMNAYYGFKTMNAHIHLLEALAELARVDHRPLVKKRLAEVHQIVRDRIAVEPGALNLYLTREWQAVPAHDSFGHDIETAYLLVEAAESLVIPEDPKTWHMARRLVDHALDWGWDESNGGFFDKGETFNGAAFDRDKVWWTQAEGLNALLLLHKKFGHETDRYEKAFRKQWDFIAKHLIDPEHGGWFEETDEAGALLGDGHKATQWKANYHTARAMMRVAKELAPRAGE